MDSIIEMEMKRWKVPGMAVAIVYHGKVVFSQGYGVRETGKPEKVDEHTLFAIGSNTKAFTGTLVSMLELRGNLSADDRVSKFIPDFLLMDSMAGKYATIADMLSHRAGFKTFAGDFVAWGSSYSTADLIYRLRYLQPSYDYRTRFGYFNMGYAVTGEILKRATGKDWHTLVKEMILSPLGMTHTLTSTNDLLLQKNVASPHTYNDKEEVISIPHRNIDNIAPCGSILSSVSDMSKWLLYQLDTLNAPIQRQAIWNTWKARTLIFTGLPNAQTPGRQHFGNYGLGWFLNDYHGKLLISHSGGVDGMLSRCGFLPEEGFGVVILTNYDDQELFECLFYKILDAYLGTSDMDHCRKAYEQFTYFKEKREEEKKLLLSRIDPKAKIPGNIKNSFPGKYHNTHYGEITVQPEKDHYQMRFSAHPNLIGKLLYLGPDEFYLTYNDPEFRWSILHLDLKGGNVSGLTLSLPDFLETGDYDFRKK
ncbi:MAG: serine hydrolase [Bacteroidia bacterium]|nr:serine hydrolase [Bacteroidia bacterium]